MPWSLQTVGSTIFYIPGGSNLPLAGTGTIASNNNGTIIMVGRGTNSIAAYNIGTNTWSIPSTIFSTTGRSVAVGNNKYVAVGEGGNTFAITNNGTTWGTIASPPFSTAGYDIVYAGSTWVAVGTGTNSVAYFNGTSWVSVTNGITSGYGLFYDATVPRIWATGSGSNTIAYASAATGPWTGAAIANMTRVNAIGKVTISNGTMVTVGYGNTSSIAQYSTNYYTSSPTFSYSITTDASLVATGGGAVAYGNGIWIWGGIGNTGGNSLAYSTNGGQSWTGAGIGPTLFTYAARIVYGNGIFLATGNRGTAAGNSTLFSSTNGISWTKATDNYTSNGGRGLYYDASNSTWYNTGVSSNTIYKSTNNGSTWTSFTTNSLFTQTSDICTDGNGTWVMTGYYSSSGGNCLAYISGSTYVTGLSSSTGWTVAKTNVINGWNRVVYNNGLWLAGGSNFNGYDILVKSNNGTSWTSLFTNDSSKFTQISGIYSDGNRWYISGAGAYQFAYSSNNSPNNSGDFTFVSNITMGGGDIAVSPASQLYVAGGIGTNNLQKSSDGTSWTSVTSPFSVAVNDVKNNGTTWVAVGEGGNTIATSSDGTSWTGRGTTTFSISGNKVRWNSTQNKWYAVGEGGNTLAASTDGTGTSWTGISTTGYVDISGMGLAFN